jgi:signal transduction histidine kinase
VAPAARSAARRVIAGAALLLAACLAVFAIHRAIDVDDPTQRVAAEAAPALPGDDGPPRAGWLTVALPDHWSARWPAHDGAVWYRLRWHGAADAPSAILVDAYTSAAAAWVNGTLVYRDASLVEPLSQNQYRPHLWIVAAPVLRDGENVLLVRVAGRAGYWPGLGPVRIGAPVALAAAYERQLLWHYDAQFANIGACLGCGLICLCFWFFRRHESTYGWAALGAFAWVGYEWHLVTPAVWPFAATLGLMRFKTLCILFTALAAVMVLARLSGLRFARLERSAFVAVAAVAMLLMFAPEGVVLPLRHGTQAVTGIAVAVAQLAFIGHTLAVGPLRSGRGLFAGLTIPVLPVVVQEVLATANVVPQRWFVMPEMVPLFLMALSALLAGRLADTLRVAERFNEQLRDHVAQARDQLRAALERERAREISSAREAERQRLVHDLHDGFGSTLAGNITALEAGAAQPSTQQMLTLLRDVRDDLRLVIDTSFGIPSERFFAEAFAAVRHRLSRSLERQGVAVDWSLAELHRFDASASQTLELTRILQELVTNAIRHGAATELRIAIAPDAGGLCMTVADNGRGFDPAAELPGVGLRGLRLRAQRLGGGIEFASGPHGTRVCVRTAIVQAPAAS